MTSLPLIYPFPIQARAWIDLDFAMAAYEGKTLPPPRVMSTWEELARSVADLPGDNEMPNALHAALDVDPAYRAAVSAMPTLREAKEIARYRKDYPLNDYGPVEAEVQAMGLPLSQGQVLFHGGAWPGSALPSPGMSFMTPTVLSTSLSPQVAGVHAYSDKQRNGTATSLWMLRVANGSTTPAFAFNPSRGQTHGHERELLLGKGALIRCIGVEMRGTMPLIFADLL